MSYMYALPGMPIIRSEDVAIRNSTIISKPASNDKIYQREVVNPYVTVAAIVS